METQILILLIVGAPQHNLCPHTPLTRRIPRFPVPVPLPRPPLPLAGLAQKMVPSGDEAASTRKLRSSTRSRRGRYESSYTSCSGSQHSERRDPAGDGSGDDGTPPDSSKSSPEQLSTALVDQPSPDPPARPCERRSRVIGQRRPRYSLPRAWTLLNASSRQAQRRVRALRVRQRTSTRAHHEVGAPVTAP